MSRKSAQPSRERMRRYRQRMRAQGLRPVQAWVYDTSSPRFKEEIQRELAAIRNSAEEQEILEWIEAVYEWPAD